MFDKSWEKKIYKKNKQMNDYPYDWVVSTTNKFLKKRKKLNALEIGSGTGNNLNFLKAFGFNKIVGIEGSKSACDYARKKFKKDKSIKILNLDFNKYSYDEKFNLILDRGSLTHNKINDIKISKLSDEELENVCGGGLHPSDLCIISIVGAVSTYKKCTCPLDD